MGQRALWIPSNLKEDRVHDVERRRNFNVVTNGRRSMPPYQFQVPERDRWAIVAYVRALQRSTGATEKEVPAVQSSGLK